MESTESLGELPVVTSCFGVILEENQSPVRIYLVHNNADPVGPDGKEGKPAGWGLPGGGGEQGETPFQTVIREVKVEIGIETKIATYGKNKTGEILFEEKLIVDSATGKPAMNKIYVFHLERANHGFKRIMETHETGRLMLATFGSILTMPLAKKKIRSSGGSVAIIENTEGIYFSTRERIFGVAERIGYDFRRLIPNLNELLPQIDKEDVGNYIYNLLLTEASACQ